MPQKATDIGLPEKLNIMLYGEFATGKTTGATTFPKPILFYDVDLRNQTYAGMKGVEYEVYKDTGRRPRAFRDFMNDLRKYQTDSKFKTVVLDSTTTLLDIMSNDILGQVAAGSGGGATEGLSLSQWGTVTERFRNIFQIMRGYDTHTIIISHPQMFQDDTTGEIKRVTMMIGKKFPQRAPLFFDEIYRCFTEGKGEDKQYLWQTRSNKRYSARSSLNLRDEKGKVIPILEEHEPQDFRVINEKVEEARDEPEKYIRKVKKLRSG